MLSSLPPKVDRWVNMAVICFIFRKSTSRVSIDFTPPTSDTEMKFVIGSITTTFGSTCLMTLMHGRQVRFQAQAAGPNVVEVQQALLDPGLEVKPDRGHYYG